MTAHRQGKGMRNGTFYILILSALAAAPLHAAFEDLDAAPRATAMSGAYAAQSEDISSIFYNPAGIIGVSRYNALLAQETLYSGLSDGSSLSRMAVGFGMPIMFGGSYRGTFGFGYDTLSLDSLYSESRMRLAYARPFGENFWFGLALARLGITYGSDEYTAINPVLASATGASAMGLDIGAIYSKGDIDFGLSIQNANQPDLGIQYPNPVDRKISLGLALKREALAWDLDLVSTGGDMRLKTGVELLVLREALSDKLRARGGFSLGSRDYRSATAGFGYRAGSYTIDYAFVYPLSGISGTMGSHHLGVSVAWGEPRGPMADRKEKEEKPEEKEETPGKGGGGAGEVQAPVQRTEPTRAEKADAVKLLRDGRNALRRGAYSEAEQAFKKADELLMNNTEVKDTLLRIALVSNVLAQALTNAERDDLLRKAVNRYADKNTDAMLYITYARQKWPKDASVGRLYNIIAKEFPETAANLRILPGITVIDQLLQDALDFIRTGRYIQAVSTLQRVLQLEPDNIPALTRMGSAYWAMEKKDIARANWQKVLDLDPENKEVMMFLKQN